MIINSCLDYDQPPMSVEAYLNDFAYFICYVRQGMPRLFWFVNGSTPVTALSEIFQAMSTSNPPVDGLGVNSSLRILALKETNNSLISCAVDSVGRIDFDYFPTPATLLVQGICKAVIMHVLTKCGI